MDCSLPGPSVHGIFQARVLEWGAIAFSDYVYTSLHYVEVLFIMCPLCVSMFLNTVEKNKLLSQIIIFFLMYCDAGQKKKNHKE